MKTSRAPLKSLLLGLFLPLLAVMSALVVAPAVHAQPVDVVELAMGETQVIDVDFDIADIILGSNSVADVALLSTRSLVVTPLAGGGLLYSRNTALAPTDLFVRDAKGKVKAAPTAY